MRTDHVCDLVLDACDLVERAQASGAPCAATIEAALHLRAALVGAVATCDDEAVASDGRAAVCELDALLAFRAVAAAA